MRPMALVGLGLLTVVPAWAQPSELRTTQLPPLQQQWQQEGSPPVQQGPVSPSPAGTDTQGMPQGGQADAGQAPVLQAAPPATFERPIVWIPAQVVKLQALDKVNAQATALTIKVGQSVTFGSLTISARACVVRPTDQPADAAAYLAVTDSHTDSPGFDGWMLENEPAVSMMEHPVYDLRVTGCT